mmetsp:Transcript_101844/g.287307  ORF Transcript_101844/g.287307 Transcript_101844/m.287307 type:complete len:320 (-) Transcript_101844:37-996(-)|eukprot:CAMPEP_0117553260 /NCGR_PEP_ID=MMETSP0784-20121206/50132_1 /TAXON_ID=39447 /ORGANISM="" /LENGTH=319 /DNA_ID=CAMNT_0005350359 /DNA_START=13 /DNA_END=972 /DNA_ORIENTATION=+
MGEGVLHDTLDRGDTLQAGLRVARVDSSWSGAFLAQARKPFVIRHDLVSNLAWHIDAAEASECVDGVSSVVFRACPFAKAARWHALLSPDGVVGFYDRSRWAVDAEEATASGASLRWRALAGQAAEGSTPPRHVSTPDCDLETVLGFWEGTSSAPAFPGSARPYVYIRGSLGAAQADALQRGSIFEELRSTASFGSEPFKATLYASRAGLQTNLHADEHSGFLVQVSGRKRVVLFSPKAARSLRCAAWGDATAPINRRSWFDDGVPLDSEWASRPPFEGKNGQEVDLGPGEALFIPKGYFHDVFSCSPETLGVVLRCTD